MRFNEGASNGNFLIESIGTSNGIKLDRIHSKIDKKIKNAAFLKPWNPRFQIQIQKELALRKHESRST